MATSPYSPYRYSPLPDGQCTRLVELLPVRGRGDPKIRVRLYVHALDSSQAYEALSYVWGGLTFRRTVECEGHAINIPDNLYPCLLELRKECPRPFLWVDAICINQADTSERSLSMPLMPLIYRKAARTICWVGAPLQPSASRLIGRLQPLWGQIAQERSLITDPDPYHADFKVTTMDLELFQADPLLKDQQAWQDLENFLGLQYFRRLWTTQDWVSCLNLVLRCESDDLSWDKFCSALEVCLFYSPSECPSSPSLLNTVISRYLRRRVHWPSSEVLSFREAVLARQNCNLEATELRDHVFSLHWMLGDAVSDLHPVDYNTDRVEIFLKAAQSHGLLSLSLAESQSRSLIEKPSWVSDWSLPRKTFLLNHPKSSFWASPVRNESCQFDTKGTMYCEGITLDFVKATSHYLPSRRHCDHYDVEGYNNVTFSEWFEFAKDWRKRSRQAEDLDTQVLLEFANTIQARGCNSIWEPSTSHDPEDLAKQMRNFLKFLEEEEMKATLDIRLFYAACLPSHGRKFGMTGRGYFCLVPKDTERGDLVCIPHGNRVPLIFRKKGYHYVNLGECYVNGCMQGEAGAMFDTSKYEVFNVV